VPVGTSQITIQVAGLTARYATTSTWDNGFVATVELTNGSVHAVQRWEVRLTYPGNVTIPAGSSWNATQQGSTGTVIFTGGPLPAAQKQSFGFQATKAAQSQQAFAPTACTVNDAYCEGF
jgi:hypothetical protein